MISFVETIDKRLFMEKYSSDNQSVFKIVGMSRSKDELRLSSSSLPSEIQFSFSEYL